MHVYYVCMNHLSVYMYSAEPASAYRRTQARGATPELRRVTDTTSHGLLVRCVYICIRRNQRVNPFQYH